MTTKVEKIAKQMNDSFKTHLHSYMLRKHNIEVRTSYNFLAGVLITVREDGEAFTPEQKETIVAFEDGYLAAMEQVR